MTRTETLVDLLSDHLDRKSIPDRLKGKPPAEQAERGALLRALERNAPAENVEAWFLELETELDETATTHGWPSVQRIAEIARKIRERRGGRRGGDVVQMDASEFLIEQLAGFLERKGGCLPGYAMRPDLTARLISRGDLRDEREARFLGFGLSEEQRARVEDQTMGRAEWAHHVATWARIKGIGHDEAEAECRGHRGSPFLPRGASPAPLGDLPTGEPFQRFPGPSPRYRPEAEREGPAARSSTGPVGEALRDLRARARANLGIEAPQEGDEA